MPYTINETEYAEIDGVPLATPAWTVENLEVLWSGPATRGQDRLIPGSAGVRPKRRRPTVRNLTLKLAVFGDFDWEGNPQTDTRIGLRANIDHLRANIVDEPATVNGTRTLTLTKPDGTTVSGTIHVENFEVGDGYGSGACPVILDISIKEGALS